MIDVTPTLGDRRRTKERRSSFVLFPCWGRRRRRRPRHVLGRGWSQKRNKKTRKRKRNETETNRWPRARKKKTRQLQQQSFRWFSRKSGAVGRARHRDAISIPLEGLGGNVNLSSRCTCFVVVVVVNKEG